MMETLTDSKSVVAIWNEYFHKLLNVPGDIEPEALENIQQRRVNTSLDEKPTMDEMVRTIKGLKDGKIPGADGIPVEVWKYGGANLSNRLHRWITKTWEECHVPQAWKDANIVTSYKKETKQNVVITGYISSFRSRQDLYSDPTEQTLKPHNPRSGSRDAVWLSFEPEDSGHDLLPATTLGKVHRARPLYIGSHSFLYLSPSQARRGF